LIAGNASSRMSNQVLDALIRLDIRTAAHFCCHTRKLVLVS
jgi:hypothetical protein